MMPDFCSKRSLTLSLSFGNQPTLMLAEVERVWSHESVWTGSVVYTQYFSFTRRPTFPRLRSVCYLVVSVVQHVLNQQSKSHTVNSFNLSDFGCWAMSKGSVVWIGNVHKKVRQICINNIEKRERTGKFWNTNQADVEHLHDGSTTEGSQINIDCSPAVFIWLYSAFVHLHWNAVYEYDYLKHAKHLLLLVAYSVAASPLTLESLQNKKNLSQITGISQRTEFKKKPQNFLHLHKDTYCIQMLRAPLGRVLFPLRRQSCGGRQSHAATCHLWQLQETNHAHYLSAGSVWFSSGAAARRINYRSWWIPRWNSPIASTLTRVRPQGNHIIHFETWRDKQRCK